MSAKTAVKLLGIIAGGGALPGVLAESCVDKGIKPFIIAFYGITNPDVVEGYPHVWLRLGAIGAVIKTLKAYDVRDLVLIGGVQRPRLLSLRPDFTTLMFFLFHGGLTAKGDSAMLDRVRLFIESRDFKIHGIHTFVSELLVSEGALGQYQPSQHHWCDIHSGFRESQQHGLEDKGQAVLVKDSRILGKEDAQGTDILIKNYGEPGAVLVKTCKPQQDMDLDMPTIGVQTIQNAVTMGLSGIAVHAESSLIVDRNRVVKIADAHKLFLVGIDPKKSFKMQ